MSNRPRLGDTFLSKAHEYFDAAINCKLLGDMDAAAELAIGCHRALNSYRQMDSIRTFAGLIEALSILRELRREGL